MSSQQITRQKRGRRHGDTVAQVVVTLEEFTHGGQPGVRSKVRYAREGAAFPRSLTLQQYATNAVAEHNYRHFERSQGSACTLPVGQRVSVPIKDFHTALRQREPFITWAVDTRQEEA